MFVVESNFGSNLSDMTHTLHEAQIELYESLFQTPPSVQESVHDVEYYRFHQDVEKLLQTILT
jgi:hypothetical protein